MYVSPRFQDVFSTGSFRTGLSDRWVASEQLDFDGGDRDGRPTDGEQRGPSRPELDPSPTSIGEFTPAPMSIGEFTPAPVFMPEFIPAPISKPVFIPAKDLESDAA